MDKNVKKAKVLSILIIIFWLLGLTGALLTRQFDLNGIYDNFILFTIIKFTAGISHIFFSGIIIYIIILTAYNFYKNRKFKNALNRFILYFLASAIGLTTIAALGYATFIIAGSQFGRLHVQSTETLAFVDFHHDAIDMNKEKGYADFSQAASFEWDKLYVFSNSFNQDELDNYVDGKTYRQIKSGFKRISKDEYHKQGSIVCFVKDEFVLICNDAGMEIFQSEDMETLIYYGEFTTDDAIFQCEVIRDYGPNIWTLVDD